MVTSVHNLSSLFLHFVELWWFVSVFMISRCWNFSDVLGDPRQTSSSFFSKYLEVVLLKMTAPITQKLCRHVSQPFDVDVLLFCNM